MNGKKDPKMDEKPSKMSLCSSNVTSNELVTMLHSRVVSHVDMARLFGCVKFEMNQDLERQPPI